MEKSSKWPSGVLRSNVLRLNIAPRSVSLSHLILQFTLVIKNTKRKDKDRCSHSNV